jgi:diguanylate cyclase (GGDEF)-like protein
MTFAKCQYRILVIDDNHSIHQDFSKILSPPASDNPALDDMEAALFGSEKPTSAPMTFELDFASQGAEGLTMVEHALAAGRPYALTFVDGRMPPGWDGIETIQRLWQADPELQTVLCTAYADYSWQEIRRILGETDSLLIIKKPFDNMEVLQLAHALTRKWELAREVKGRLHQLAFYDSLTGLPNKALLSDRLALALENAKRKQCQTALLFIDLDNFKRINDSLGHTLGDELLKIVSERIVACLRASDTVGLWIAARLGGDEFIVVLPELESERGAALVAQRIADKVGQPLTLDQHQFLITLSIGIAIYPEDGESDEDLLKNADLAMYFAKRNDHNSFAFYQQSMNIRALKRLTLESELRQAIGRQEFSLHYQPQLDLRTGEISGLEALLRWRNTILGNVSPLEFIDVAEENGMIVTIGTWVLRTACTQAKAWIDQGLTVPRISVNVSVKQFAHPQFISTIEEVLAETGLESHLLEIEITETLLADNFSEFASILQKVKLMNISVAIDDFGTGYSSLSRIKDFPIDCLKIDRSFVSGIESSPSDQSLVKAMTAMAACMQLTVIAEGVETPEQLEFLRSINCQEMQGYIYSKPLTAVAAEAFLRNPPLWQERSS